MNTRSFIECVDCGDDRKAVSVDPRNPPLDESICLCEDCATSAYIEAIDDARGEVEALEHRFHKELARWQK